MNIYNLLFLCIAGFLAAFIDSIAGGGGIISVPAYLIAGLPPHITLGTNKLTSSMASLTSSINFIKSGNCNFKLLKTVAPFTLIGSVLGVKAVLLMDESFLQPLVLILVLAIGIYTFFSKSLGEKDNFKGFTRKNLLLSVIFGFSLGFYDGFFGPGTGSFLVFGFISILGFDFLKASANAKVLNFISNISALITFAISGNISYTVGIPVSIFMIIGAKVGTKLAISKGSRLIRPIFIVMSLAVAVKILIELI